MSERPRLHQSYSAYLLGRGGKTPRELRQLLESGGKAPTKPMLQGSLVDQLLFGGGSYHELEPCTYRSGPNKGKRFDPEDYSSADAREQRDAILSSGGIPALKNEVDTAREQAESLRYALMRNGVDLYNGVVRCLGEEILGDEPRYSVYTQPLIRWPGCEGTLDILQLGEKSWRIIDTKVSQRADEEWLSRQAAAMGWDVQAGAYIEACVEGLGLDPERFAGYGIAVVEKSSGLHMASVRWLTDMFMECGRAQWQRCKEIWEQLLSSGEWPGLLDGELSPPGYHVSRIFDRADTNASVDDLGDLELDLEGIEVIS